MTVEWNATDWAFAALLMLMAFSVGLSIYYVMFKTEQSHVRAWEDYYREEPDFLILDDIQGPPPTEEERLRMHAWAEARRQDGTLQGGRIPEWVLARHPWLMPEVSPAPSEKERHKNALDLQECYEEENRGKAERFGWGDHPPPEVFRELRELP